MFILPGEPSGGGGDVNRKINFERPKYNLENLFRTSSRQMSFIYEVIILVR